MGAQAVAVNTNAKAIRNNVDIRLVGPERSFPSEGIWLVPHANRCVWKLLYVCSKSAQSIGCAINFVNQSSAGMTACPPHRYRSPGSPMPPRTLAGILDCAVHSGPTAGQPGVARVSINRQPVKHSATGSSMPATCALLGSGAPSPRGKLPPATPQPAGSSYPRLSGLIHTFRHHTTGR